MCGQSVFSYWRGRLTLDSTQKAPLSCPVLKHRCSGEQVATVGTMAIITIARLYIGSTVCTALSASQLPAKSSRGTFRSRLKVTDTGVGLTGNQRLPLTYRTPVPLRSRHSGSKFTSWSDHAGSLTIMLSGLAITDLCSPPLNRSKETQYSRHPEAPAVSSYKAGIKRQLEFLLWRPFQSFAWGSQNRPLGLRTPWSGRLWRCQGPRGCRCTVSTGR